MGCNCGKNRAKATVRTADGKPAEVVGFQITWPDGTQTPANQPIFSMIEARKMMRGRGGTVRRLLREVS